MNQRQIGILNSLVTFAAENIPGELSPAEVEVAKIVASWMFQGTKTHDYKVVNASHHEDAEGAANAYAEQGWRVVAAMGARGIGYADQLVLERPVGITHPDD